MNGILMRETATAPARSVTSRASSYHTAVLDHFTTTTTSSSPAASAESLSSSSTTRPSSPEDLVYTTETTQRKGTAFVVSQPTLVNFVPTSDIQTAVSITADRIVIDTILPPTATLRAHAAYAYRPNATATTQPQGQPTAPVAAFNTEALLQRHKEEVLAKLTQGLTANYDPTGTIKQDIFTTLTEVTRFPDPVGTNRKKNEKGKCPCICCQLGCDRPLEPFALAGQVEEGVISGGVRSDQSFLQMRETGASGSATNVLQPNDVQGGSGGEMTRSKSSRFGFLTFGRSRSRSSVDLANKDKKESRRSMQLPTNSAVLPEPAPPLPAAVTDQVVPPKPTRSRSFSDLVRRRRKKHESSTSTADESIPPVPQIPADKFASRRSMDVPSSRSMGSSNFGSLPSRSSSSNFASLPTGAAAPINPGPGRYSLDSGSRYEPSSPQPPPRRSSKLYAIIGRKPAPQASTATMSSSSSMPNGFDGKNAYSNGGGIGRIVEEEELSHAGSSDVGTNGGVARRQSALMSSYQPMNGSELYGGNGGVAQDQEQQGWGVRNGRSGRDGYSATPGGEGVVGVAI